MTEENKLGGFDFALQMMKAGHKVARIGWNGNDMWICRGEGNPALEYGYIRNKNMRQFAFEQPGRTVEVLPYIIMKAADNKIIVGWLASQTDMLAEDWMVVQ